MKRLFLFTLVLSAIGIGFGCGGNSAANSAETNANAQQQTVQYADAATAMAEGNRLLDSNQTEQAIEAFKQAAALNPDLGEAYFKLGIAYSLLEAEEKGKLSTDPQLPGEAPKKEPKPESQKQFEKAVEVYKKWVAEHDQDSEAWFNLGRAYNKLNQDPEAEKALRQAAKLHPDNVDYETELGGILVKLAKYREAIDPLKKALDIDPDNSRAADLLDDAEAGRTRIDYTPPKADAKSSSNSNANTEIDAEVNTVNPSNSAKKQETATPEKKVDKDIKPAATPVPKKPAGDAKQHT